MKNENIIEIPNEIESFICLLLISEILLRIFFLFTVAFSLPLCINLSLQCP